MWQTSSFHFKSMNMINKYYIGWVRSGKDGKGLVKYRPRKQIANAVTSMVGGGYHRPSRRVGQHHTAYSI